MKYSGSIIICIALTVVFNSYTYAQKKRKKAETTFIASDTLKKDESGKFKKYNQLISDKAISTDGLFKVHFIDDRYYFEIPKRLFNRDILVVNRIISAAAERINHKFGFKGDLVGNNVIQFTQTRSNKIFIRTVANPYRSEDSSENGLHRALSNSSIQSIVAAFDISAMPEDSSSVVIDLTDFINSDNVVFGFDDSKSRYLLALGSFQQDKSFIESIQNFETNIEITTLKTFNRAAGGNGSYVVNSSILLLPEVPMKPRYADNRVGYFTLSYLDFDEHPQMVMLNEKVLRRRLEPRPEDRERYLRGELVEPAKPIVFYIDPATPKKWIPYLIAGVNAWQKAFEKAGFKNAIYAKEAPVEDPEWNINDARHNVIVYKPSEYMNANGPNIHDPRSGEILESHISWHHNILKLLHEWYFIQASPVDPRARTMRFDDELMGSLIKFVCSHEVGHTLGLKHNFGASSLVPVDSLRSKTWVEKNGLCPSIMDYARFNYVAQPGDNISAEGLVSKIGVYDEWAIEWGYRWFPDFESEEAERMFFNKWIIERVSQDKNLFFGSENTANDPRCQSEDLGDDAVKAGEYGIKNLKLIMKNLIAWTSEPGKGYENLEMMHAAVISQYKKYLNHVISNIAGQYYTPKTTDQEGVIREYPGRDAQKAAVKFLERELFKTPLWLADKQIYLLTGAVSDYQIAEIQKTIMDQLLSNEMYSKFLFSQYGSENNYTYVEFLNDLKSYIFKELYTKSALDRNRRNLQKIYVSGLIGIINPSPNKNESAANYFSSLWNDKTDMLSIVKGQFKQLIEDINTNLVGIKDQPTRLHLIDIRERLKLALNP